jgi:hypothetical protein
VLIRIEAGQGSTPCLKLSARLCKVNQEIALKRSLTEPTVRNYLIRIFDKLGISSRVELVLYAFSGAEGMADPVAPRAHSASA